MCQLDRATECPGIWSKHYSGCVCDEGGLDEINTSVGRLHKTALLNVRALIQSVEGMNRTKEADPPSNKSCLTELRHRSSPAFGLK